MWGFVDCTRYFMNAGRPNVVLLDASMIVETHEKVALFVRAGSGKSTIVRMLAGVERPDWGTVLRDSGGWPLGYSGSLHGDMSGAKNVANLAELADVDPLELSAFCLEFSELEDFYFQPVKLYSSSMRARLGMAVSLGLPARTYLADDRLTAGDEHFRRKCLEAVSQRLAHTGLIFVASNPRAAKEVCDTFYVVDGGEIIRCDGYDHAVELFDSATGVEVEDSLEADLPIFDLA